MAFEITKTNYWINNFQTKINSCMYENNKSCNKILTDWLDKFTTQNYLENKVGKNKLEPLFNNLKQLVNIDKALCDGLIKYFGNTNNRDRLIYDKDNNNFNLRNYSVRNTKLMDIDQLNSLLSSSIPADQKAKEA